VSVDLIQFAVGHTGSTMFILN